MKVLIVEDERKTADYLCQGLTGQGCVVEVAYAGIEETRIAHSWLGFSSASHS